MNNDIDDKKTMVSGNLQQKDSCAFRSLEERYAEEIKNETLLTLERKIGELTIEKEAVYWKWMYMKSESEREVEIENGLRGCPFCGSRPRVIGEIMFRDGSFDAYTIKCSNGDECGAEIFSDSSDPEDAVTAWNRRP